MLNLASNEDALTGVFNNGIRHPDLYLWDSWSYVENGKTHLYCLAVNRKKEDGTSLIPSERNNCHFHIRHFLSNDGGFTWLDKGIFQQVAQAEDEHDKRNIWSGSVLPIHSGKIIAAYTGIRHEADETPFLQNLAAGFSLNGDHFQPGTGQVLLCPKRDNQLLRSHGYYFSSQRLGDLKGEEGGPILAFRDPYLISSEINEHSISLVWAAKSSKNQPAMGMADIVVDSDKFLIKKIYSPIHVPDSHLFSQLEVPKVYFDSIKKRYVLIIASSTRYSESQPDHEIEKCIRIYFSEDLMGPWHTGGNFTSKVAGLENLFGMTVLEFDQERQCLICIAPYTEMACEEDMLTFSSRFEIDISQMGEIEQLVASF